MRKHQKTLNELIEENKREIMLKNGNDFVGQFRKVLEESKPTIPANQTPQIDLLYRDIQLLNDERNRLKAENAELYRLNAEFSRVSNEKQILIESYQTDIKRLEKHCDGFKRDLASQAHNIHKLKNRIKEANGEIERLGGEKV